MKQLVLSLLIIPWLLFSDNETVLLFDPTLVVVIMVKNEEEVIIPTLEPFVKAGINSICVFDTGSTDNTVQVTERFFKNHPEVTGYIDQEAFVNFEVSRNRALERARQHFPQAGFLLMIDAEFYVQGAEHLQIFCCNELIRSIYDSNAPTSYNICVDVGHCVTSQTRLLRAQADDKWVGKVHEVVVAKRVAPGPEEVTFYYRPKEKGRTKTNERYLWDKAILLEEYKNDPKSPRTIFYLAQTYECLGDIANALRYYHIRENVLGWDEENFMTLYRIAQLYDKLGPWPEALDYYFKAFSLRPSRAEPLVRIAQHYWNTDEYALCYLFAYQATKIDYPKDILFVEKELYDLTCHDLVGRAAYYIGQMKRGKQAVLKALAYNPSLNHLYHNLKCYEETNT